MMRRDGRAPRGFSIVELVVSISFILVMATFAIPVGTEYLRSAAVQGAAREAQVILSAARSEAIKQNCSVIVTRTTNGFTFSRLNCIAPAGIFYVPGMTSSGVFPLAPSTTITGSASVQFDRLGSAAAPATFTVTSTRWNATRTMQVIVDVSGRTRIQQ